jgi:hypothetical protein
MKEMIAMNKRTLTIANMRKGAINQPVQNQRTSLFPNESPKVGVLRKMHRRASTQLNFKSMIDQFEFRSICLRWIKTDTVNQFPQSE